MARINTNVSSLTAQRGLGRAQKTLSDTLQRLSPGLRINRGADDPAGLIASESLRSEISGLNQAIDNSSRASKGGRCSRSAAGSGLGFIDKEPESAASTVRATGPAAGPAHASAHFVDADFDAAIPGFCFLCRRDPTDPLVSCQWGDIGPEALFPAHICRIRSVGSAVSFPYMVTRWSCISSYSSFNASCRRSDETGRVWRFQGCYFSYAAGCT